MNLAQIADSLGASLARSHTIQAVVSLFTENPAVKLLVGAIVFLVGYEPVIYPSLVVVASMRWVTWLCWRKRNKTLTFDFSVFEKPVKEWIVWFVFLAMGEHLGRVLNPWMGGFTRGFAAVIILYEYNLWAGYAKVWIPVIPSVTDLAKYSKLFISQVFGLEKGEK